MIFSVGILYASADLLKLVSTTRAIDQRFPEMFRTFSVASPSATLEVAQTCEWLMFDIGGHLEVTNRGQQILDALSPEAKLRIQLTDMIAAYAPPWAALLKRGRHEAINYLPLNAQQCLREAGLFETIDIEIVSWWDNVTHAVRKKGDEEKLAVGRTGERLSLEHERRRTKTEPVWQAVESNLCGFDILSVVGPQDRQPLNIEVKTSDSIPSTAVFWVTRNEWNVAQCSRQYIFHLWALRPTPKLFVVDADEVAVHISSDHGSGHWENASIPFEAVLPDPGHTERGAS